MNDDPIYRRPQAARYLGTTIGALAQLAYVGKGPKFYKPSPRRVYYRKSDLDAWVNAYQFTSTAQEIN
jgi:hypothetical protein